MKRALAHRFAVLLLAGTLLVLAGVAWGAAARPLSVAKKAVPAASAARVRTAKRATQPVAVARSKRAAKAATHKSAPAVQAQGMRVFRDPETGEIGPPTSENTAAIVREAEPPVDVTNIPQVQLKNGGWELLTEDKLQDAMIVQIDKNGHRVVRCVTDPQAALKQAPVAAPQPVPATTREDR
jgi:hypothetical protein